MRPIFRAKIPKTKPLIDLIILCAWTSSGRQRIKFQKYMHLIYHYLVVLLVRDISVQNGQSSTINTKKRTLSSRREQPGKAATGQGSVLKGSYWVFMLPVSRHAQNAYCVLGVVLGLTHQSNSKELQPTQIIQGQRINNSNEIKQFTSSCRLGWAARDGKERWRGWSSGAGRRSRGLKSIWDVCHGFLMESIGLLVGVPYESKIPTTTPWTVAFIVDYIQGSTISRAMYSTPCGDVPGQTPVVQLGGQVKFP